MQENPKLNFVSNLIKEKLHLKLNRLELRNKDEQNDLVLIQTELSRLNSN